MPIIHCCVPGCKESGAMHKVLHGFPNPDKDMERFKTWVYAIGPVLLGLEDKYIYKYRRVCHSHFTVKHCCRNNRISNIAVPILNMPDSFILNGDLQIITNVIDNIATEWPTKIKTDVPHLYMYKDYQHVPPRYI